LQGKARLHVLGTSSCPALCRASTSFQTSDKQDVDGRDKPGHDADGDLAFYDNSESSQQSLSIFGVIQLAIVSPSVAR
jgi:hypothetical protein